MYRLWRWGLWLNLVLTFLDGAIGKSPPPQNPSITPPPKTYQFPLISSTNSLPIFFLFFSEKIYL